MAFIPPIKDTRTDYDKWIFNEKFDSINNEKSIYEWSVIVTPAKKRWLYSAIVTLIPCAIFIAMSFMISSSIGKTAIIVFPILCFCMFLLFRYLLYPDILYKFKITKKGVCSKKQQSLSKTTIITIQTIAWCCVAIFIIAMSFIGPIALAGAGGGIVLAFGFLNFKPSIEKDFYLFNRINKLSTLSPDKYYLINDRENFETKGILFFFIPPSLKEKIVSAIKENSASLIITDNTAAGDNQEQILKIVSS